MNKTVLVTGIGGNVGQGILRNILSMKESIRLIGTNATAFSAGNHLCDKVYEVPMAFEDNYVSELLKVCELEKVDLVIPSTDAEGVCLSKIKGEFSTPILTSDFTSCSIFYDKLETSRHFDSLKLRFAESWIPTIEPAKAELHETILKPRSGRGSRGIVTQCKTLDGFGSDYMAQKLYDGPEITSAFYVTKDRQIIGPFTFVRELSAGTTVACVVEKKFDDQLLHMANTLAAATHIIGGCNIQAIIAHNEVIPFEVNCRFSGTNSIRSQFGFTDVAWGIDEHLFNRKPRIQELKTGRAVRILMDVIYPDASMGSELNKNSQHRIF